MAQSLTGQGRRARKPAPLRICVLGAFDLTHGSRTIAVSRASQRVLAFLAVNGRRASRSMLAGNLWPEVAEATALARLRTVLWRLERVDKLLLVVNPDVVGLDNAVHLDVEDLEAVAHEALRGGEPSEHTIGTLSNPAELLPDSSDDWIILERERIRLLRFHALETTVERLSDARRFGLAIDLANRLVASDPLRETAHRLLISSHLAAGNRPEALRRFAAYRDRLASELSLEPAAEIEQLLVGPASPTAEKVSAHHAKRRNPRPAGSRRQLAR